MDDKRDLEMLADSILDQHRTGRVGGREESLHQWALKRQASREARWGPMIRRAGTINETLILLVVVVGALLLLAISSG